MALTPTVYATLGGMIGPETIYRIFQNLGGATVHGVQSLHMMLQSSGGTVGDGISLYNYFRTMPIDLHVYNGGTVASIAVLAYLGAAHRYASAHSTFIIHRTRITPQGVLTAAQMRANTSSLSLDDARTEAILRAHTSIPADRWALLETQDVFFDANEAVQFRIADGIREFQVPAGNQIWNI